MPKTSRPHRKPVPRPAPPTTERGAPLQYSVAGRLQWHGPADDLEISLRSDSGPEAFRVVRPDSQLGFLFSFTSLDLDEHFARHPGARLLFFQVHRRGSVLADTRDTLPWDPESPASRRGDPLTLPIRPPERAFRVEGTVYQQGRPRRNARLLVRAFNADLRQDVLLAEAPVENDGRYVLTFTSALLRAEQASPDLIVRLFNRREGGSPLVESPLRQGIRDHETLDLFLDGTPILRAPVFERTTEALQPLLTGLDADALGPTQVALLARQAGLPPREVLLYAHSLGRARETGLDVQVFYGLLDRLPTPLLQLLRAGRPRWQAALESAVAKGRVDADLAGSLDATLDALENQVVEKALDPSGARPALAEVMAAAGLSEARQRNFLRRWLRNEEPPARFWEAILSERILSREQARSLQFSLQLLTLTFHVPLVTALRGRADIASGRDLARLSSRDWRELIEAQGVPQGMPGRNAQERRGNYQALLLRVVEDAFPTDSLFHRLIEEEAVDTSDLEILYRNVAALDLMRQAPARILAEHPRALEGVGDAERLRRDLDGMAAILRLAPPGGRTDAVRALYFEAGLSSSVAIQRFGLPGLLRMADRLGGEAAARDLFAKAQQTAAMSLLLVAKYSPLFNQGFPGGIPDSAFDLEAALPDPPPEGLPDFASLFPGGLDFCACRHCRSVLGPAAYFVDLLQFTRKARDAEGRTGLNLLRQRRPDLDGIQLSCENANTALPHIDLALEILERVVERDDIDLGEGAVPQTLASAEELRLYPEHTRIAAYATLAQAHYPSILPFDLAVAEAEAYLKMLGLAAADLIDMRRPAPGSPLELLWATRSLGVTPEVRDLITGADAAPVHSLYGFASAASFQDALLNPETPNVDVLLERSGLDLPLLEGLLQARFVNPSQTAIEYAEGSCDSAMAHVDLGAEALLRLARFRRLQQASRLPIPELDRVLARVDGLGEGAFLLVARIRTIKERFPGLSTDALLAWWGPLSTLGHGEDPSPYHRLFLDPITFPDAEDRARFALNAAGDDLSDTTRSLVNPDGTSNEDVASRVCAALGLRADRLRELLPELPDAALNLSNLSHLYRLDSLLRALGMDLDGLRVLQALSGLTPFGDGAEAGSETALLFLDHWERLRTSGVETSLADAWLRLRGEAMPAEESLLAILSALRATLLAIREENPAGEMASPADLGELALHLSRIRQLSENAILEQMSPRVGLEAATAAFLLQALGHPDSDGAPAMEAFFDEGFLDPDFELASLAVLPALRRILAHLHLIGALAKAGRLNLPDLVHLFPPAGQADQAGGFNLAVLPAEPLEAPAAGQWEAFLELLEAFRLNRFFPRETSLFRFLAGERGSVDQALQELSSLLPWNLEDLRFLAGPEALGLTLEETRRVEWLTRLEAVLHIAHRAGVPAARIWAWSELAGDFAQRLARARDIRHAARAKLGEALWPKAAEPAGQSLRAARRDALQGYVIARFASLRTPFDLYQRYLLDPEINACFMTSRIRQATASVQLFIQRIWMNLEGSLAFPSEGDKEVWEWMKNYRVWEANRKVFLYPENWLRADFLDRKTPFFQELESELLQDAITEEKVERAFRNYLSKLEDVARLEPAGMYEEGDRLHVFSRTRGDPPRYYYRVREKDGTWSPWSAVDADIEGNHLIPVVYQGRLLLFWAVFEQQTGGTVDGETEPASHYLIRLKWSRYENGAWTPTTASKRTLSTECKVNAARHGTRHFYFGGYNLFDTMLSIWSTFYLDADCPNTIPLGSFVFSGCTEDPQVMGGSKLVPYRVPFAVRNDYMKFSAPDSVDLAMFLDAEFNNFGTVYPHQAVVAPLFNPPTDFSVLTPHQHLQYVQAQSPFLYEDRDRVFVLDSVDAGPLAPGHGSGGSFTETQATPAVLPNVLYRYLGASSGGAQAQPAGAMESLAFTGAAEAQADCYAAAEAEATLGTDGLSCLGPPVGIGPAPEGPGSQSLSLASLTDAALGPVAAEPVKRFQVAAFYHPFACTFLSTVNRQGLFGLLQPPPPPEPPPPSNTLFRQALRNPDFQFSAVYQIGNASQNALLAPFPVEGIDFSHGGAYSQYNWEIFFHLPLLMAGRLKQEQRFEEAQRWLHTVFNPTRPVGEGPRKYWMLKPFFEFSGTSSPLDLMRLINEGDPDLAKQVAAWRHDAFNPHRLARMRPVAYMKAVVMQYIDLLVAWGDSLFRQDTMEAVQEAAQLYVMAALLLGEKPRQAPAREPASLTFAQIEDDLDSFSNALVQMELQVLVLHWHLPKVPPAPSSLAFSSAASAPQPPPGLLPPGVSLDALLGGSPAFAGETLPPKPPNPFAPTGFANPEADVTDPLQSALYFCVPPNDKLLGYWDLVADRLFKVRNCMDIEGRLRSLPLFEPPIDPALLIEAKQAGLNLASVLNDLSLPLPPYRFHRAMSQAVEFCAEVKNLGSQLLSVLEKQDAESLALLRAGQEERLADDLIALRKQAIEEAEGQIPVWEEARKLADLRAAHYQGLIDAGDSEYEDEQRKGMDEGKRRQDKAARRDYAAAILRAFPGFDFTGGYQNGPFVSALVSYGTTDIAEALTASASKFHNEARNKDHEAGKAAFENSLFRRDQDWELQKDLARQELEQIDKQIAAARIRIEMAKRELAHQELQLETAREQEAFLTGKYTHRDLYGYLQEQIASLYFQGYQAAYEMARRAERCYRHELGIPDEAERLVGFGHWDSLRKGLLAGEKLHRQLARLQIAYLEQNRREYELTRTVSLASLDPEALLMLRTMGACFFRIPEEVFDLDHPGHYFRRLKTVSLSIPCVTGPFAGVSATLTLLGSRIRIATTLEPAYPWTGNNDDPRFRFDVGGVQAIATSQGQADGGLFHADSRDERYLPFEGSGAVSSWHLRLPDAFRQFDYQTLSDVLVHLQYTAREGGEALRSAATGSLEEALNTMVLGEDRGGLFRFVGLKGEFPNSLHQLLHPPAAAAVQETSFVLGPERFPFLFRHRPISIMRVDLILLLADGLDPEEGAGTAFDLVHPGGTVPLAAAAIQGVLRAGGELESGLGEWTLRITSVPAALQSEEGSRLRPEAVRDIGFLIRYRV